MQLNLHLFANYKENVEINFDFLTKSEWVNSKTLKTNNIDSGGLIIIV